MAHGRQRDLAYADVILHAVGTQPGGGAEVGARDAPTVGGGAPVRVALPTPPGGEREGVAPAARLSCRDLVRRVGRSAVATLLERLAIERLRRKVARLRRDAESASRGDVAYLALMRALGQGGDRAAMECLAAALPRVALLDLGGGESIAVRLLAAAERLERESSIRWQRRRRCWRRCCQAWPTR